MENSNENLKPREKMEQLGAESMSNQELLALILGSGCRECNVFELSKNLAEYLSVQTSKPVLQDLQKIRGLGKAQATKIMACLELSGRFIMSDKAACVRRPEDIVARLSFLKYENQEHLVIVTLNAANKIIRVHTLTTGLVNQTPVHPREAFVKAIEDRAVAVVFAHNHPSGSCVPSKEDITITRVLCAAGRVLKIPVLDHLVIGKTGFDSICAHDPELFEKNYEL
ncbi:MAG: DNA repair protein RadC [Fibrobacter sp.]|nr:DNA repair protein RadC [Fibrobacter sp.]